jgi:hypothetical protein
MEGWGCEINKFIGIRDHVEIYNEDDKGYGYTILSKLCPRSWGKSAIIRKPNQPTNYKNDLGLQAYVIERCN